MDENIRYAIPLDMRESVRAASAKRPFPLANSMVKAGDIRRLGGVTAETRLVLVLNVDADGERVQFTLTHPYVDFATDRDIVVPKSLTHLAFDLVVETDLRSVAWSAELGRAVAKVPLDIIDLCYSSHLDFPANLPVWIGMPLIGPLDARWDFKVAEGETIRSLSGATVEVVLDGELYWGIEIDPVFKTIFSEGPDSTAVALGLVELWLRQSETFVLTLEHLEELADLGLLNSENWFSAIGPISNDFFSAVVQPLLDIAISDRRLRVPGRVFGVTDLKESVYA